MLRTSDTASGEVAARGKRVALLDVQDVTVRFGGIMALDSLTFDIGDREICGLIGPNGAGKTTMFNVVSRIYQPTSGRITFDGKDLLQARPDTITKLGITRTFQNLALWPGLTVLENVMVGAPPARQGELPDGAIAHRGATRGSPARPPCLPAARRARSGRHRLPAGDGPAVRHAEAHRAGSGLGRRAEAAHARRAGQRAHPRRGRRPRLRSSATCAIATRSPCSWSSTTWRW